MNLRAIVQNEDGSPAKLNIFNLLVVLTALVDVWKPFIPAEYLPYVLAVLASINVFVSVYNQS
jgi:hypothetical protein